VYSSNEYEDELEEEDGEIAEATTNEVFKYKMSSGYN
jgi:hypothetical protein